SLLHLFGLLYISIGDECTAFYKKAEIAAIISRTFIDRILPCKQIEGSALIELLHHLLCSLLVFNNNMGKLHRGLEIILLMVILIITGHFFCGNLAIFG